MILGSDDPDDGGESWYNILRQRALLKKSEHQCQTSSKLSSKTTSLQDILNSYSEGHSKSFHEGSTSKFGELQHCLMSVFIK